MTVQRLPFGNRIPGIQFTETSILPAVNGGRDTITCIIGTAKSGPVEPTIVTSADDLQALFGDVLADNYGLRAAKHILPNTVMYVRVLSKGTRVQFKDEAVPVFVAKEGGTLLQGAEVSIEVAGDVISVNLVKEDELLESIVCSANPLDGEYIFKVYDNNSNYLKLAVSSDYEFTNKIFNGVGGSTGAQCAEGSADNLKVVSKYPDSRLNGSKFNLATTTKGLPYAKLTKNGVVLEEIPYSTEIESIDEFVARVNSSSIYIEIEELTSLAATTVTLEGGNGGTTSLEADDYIDAINKIADPAVYRVDTLIVPGVTLTNVQAHAMTICEDRGDTLYIADHPIGLKGGAVRDFIQAKGRFISNYALNSEYVACFSPWVKVKEDSVIFYPPSIIAAEMLANNDKKFFPWNACAGIQRGLVSKIVGLEYLPSRTDIDILYNDALVNPIVNITGKGFVIWGNKTTKVPAYAVAPEPICSLNVRRLINYLRKAIYDVTLPLVFEANDAFTWTTMKNLVCPILDAVVNNRGLDDYIFVCDETTNTAENIDKLTLTATLSIRPTRAAEYIDINLKVYPYTVEFEGVNE